ncbi:MAG: hypothetical protein ACI9HK_006088, partial [Pirellulaceae bacterium]
MNEFSEAVDKTYPSSNIRFSAAQERDRKCPPTRVNQKVEVAISKRAEFREDKMSGSMESLQIIASPHAI